MNLELFVPTVVVGLFASWLGGMLMKNGGYGLTSDILLGLVGSGAATAIVSGLGVAPDAGKLAVTAVVAFVGATVAIVIQRKIWYHTAA